MKKIIIALCLMFGLATMSMAQTTNPKDTKAKKAAVKKTPAEPVKKDGTPDKRYKANKKAPVGPVKKDGTPDKRYKANKTP